MRGLKPQFMRIVAQINKVASFTDAWIETHSEPFVAVMRGSHLLQMRGLKQPQSFK